MKIEINIDSTDDGVRGDFHMVMGEKGQALLQKLRDALADPDKFVGLIGEKVMNGVLYGGDGSKSKSPAVAESSGGPAGY